MASSPKGDADVQADPCSKGTVLGQTQHRLDRLEEKKEGGRRRTQQNTG